MIDGAKYLLNASSAGPTFGPGGAIQALEHTIDGVHGSSPGSGLVFGGSSPGSGLVFGVQAE